MHINEFNFFDESSSKDDFIINNVNFTPREIDIIACLLNARGTNKIASFLSIYPKTVRNHIHNIMVKSGCNSRDGIIDFIEHSDKLSSLQKHYLKLLTQAAFEKILRDIAHSTRSEKFPCKIVYWSHSNIKSSFIENFETHLRLASLDVSLELQQKHLTFSEITQESPQEHFKIYVISKLYIKNLHLDKNLNKRNQRHFSVKKDLPRHLFLLLDDDSPGEFPKELLDYPHMFLNKENDYFLAFFELLQKISPQLYTEKIISDFKQYYEVLKNSDLVRTIPLKENTTEKRNLTWNQSLLALLKKNKLIISRPLSIAFLIACLGSLLFFIVPYFQKTVHLHPSQKNKQDHKDYLARPEFSIPKEKTFLNRPELSTQIDTSFKEKKGIKTVALVGIGGAGKTTLAREYALQQHNNIIWEINAETPESLLYSFELLAEKLAQTEIDKQTLKTIQESNDPQKREESILDFVKAHLKQHPHWLIIYDNVEDFSSIQHYFPQDSIAWGDGSVILTTRDTNVQNNQHVNSVIYIRELTSQQKLTLFSKIIAQENEKKSLSPQERNIKEFLKKLPPFPLDISVAAYYLKSANPSYDMYIHNVHKLNKSFEDIQKTLLKDTGNYTKTRFSITALTIEKLLSANKDFGELLFLMSLLDSQNIPRNLLDKFKDSFVVDSLIYHLKKNSLITTSDLNSLSPKSELFIHRSIREIVLAYVIQKFTLKEKKELIEKIENLLNSYLYEAIDKENFSTIRNFSRHYEAFLKHEELLPFITKASVSSALGQISYYLGHYQKAEKLLTQSLSKENSSSKNKFEDKARTMIYLGVVKKELGDYHEAQRLINVGLNTYKELSKTKHSTIAWGFINLANIYKEFGEFNKAVDVLKKSIDIYNNTDKENNIVQLAWALVYLGEIYRVIGNYEEAKYFCEEGLKIYKHHLGNNHAKTAWSLIYLGNIYTDMGQYKEGEKALEEATRIYKKYYSDTNIELAWCLVYLGNNYLQSHKYVQAKDILENALSIHIKNYGENHIRTAWGAVFLAVTYGKLGQLQKGQLLLEKYFPLHKNHFKETHIRFAAYLMSLGEIYCSLGNYKKARYFIEKSHIINENNYGKDHSKAAQLLLSLGKNELFAKKLDVAEKFLLKALEIFQKNKHSDSSIALEYLTDLYLVKARNSKKEGNIKQAQEYKSLAKNYISQAMAIIKENFPPDSSYIEAIQSKQRKNE